MTPYREVEGYGCFGETCCFIRQENVNTLISGTILDNGTRDLASKWEVTVELGYDDTGLTL